MSRAPYSELLGYLKCLGEKDIEKITNYVLGIISVNSSLANRPDCPHCGAKSAKVIKYGHKKGKQRFLCHECGQTFMHSTNTIMAHSHFSRSIWKDFISDTLTGASLDESAQKYGFSHDTAFNMRHKVLLALQDFRNDHPVSLSGTVELDETFVLESMKGTKFTEDFPRRPRKHGAKASHRGISNEYVAICAGIQRDGEALAHTTNRAKPSSDEIRATFSEYLAPGTLVLTDGLRSYKVLSEKSGCSVIDATRTEGSFFNLNTVNSMHSFIKGMYLHYRGVATKYLNRYNALFSVVFRSIAGLTDRLFPMFCNSSTRCFWHTVHDVKTLNLLDI